MPTPFVKCLQSQRPTWTDSDIAAALGAQFIVRIDMHPYSDMKHRVRVVDVIHGRIFEEWITPGDEVRKIADLFIYGARR